MHDGSHAHDVHVQQFQDSNELRHSRLLLQVINFVNKCEAMFSTERLKISMCTLIKCLLDINFASSVKPTVNLCMNLYYLLCFGGFFGLLFIKFEIFLDKQNIRSCYV